MARQVVIIPIYWNKREAEKAAVLAAANRAAGVLRRAGLTAQLDASDERMPGAKFRHWCAPVCARGWPWLSCTACQAAWRPFSPGSTQAGGRRSPVLHCSRAAGAGDRRAGVRVEPGFQGASIPCYPLHT